MNRIPYLLFIAAMLIAGSALASAQGVIDEATAGTAFLVAFPDTTKNTFDARYPNNRYEDKCFLFIYSAVANRMSIKGNGYQRTGITLPGGAVHVIDLMGADQRAPSPIATETCKPSRGGVFRIDSEEPIVVIQYMATKFGAEAWTPLPIETWGRDYYAATLPGEIGSDISPGGEFDYNRKNKMFHAIITVVAAYDDTRVTIVPTGQVWTTGCPTTNVLLNAGEVYQVESYVDTLTANVGNPQPDFSGTQIMATKPIGVLSGNTRAMIFDEQTGLGKNSFKNMQIEWLSPAEHHGHEFVYLPTWDARRPAGAPSENPDVLRNGELIRVHFAPLDTPIVTRVDTTGLAVLQQTDTTRFVQDRRDRITRPAVYTTSTPAQAMMHTPAVVKYAGTTNGWGGYVGAAYDGWGGYMVEMVPRVRWSSVAPVYVSNHPAGMSYYLNVVTDSAHRNDVLLGTTPFVFNRGVIPGTDLVWGTMSLDAAISYVLTGRNGATFSGYVYGTLTKGGHEEYRPGATRPPDDDPQTGTVGVDPGVLHPSEYEEYLGIAFAYPLASRHTVPGESDSLEITAETNCGRTTLSIVSLRAVGLSNIRLSESVNARIFSREPFPLTGATQATVTIVPINPLQSASATIVISDRTGRTWEVPYRHTAERIDLNPSNELDFGLMTPGRPTTKTVRVTNPLDVPLTVERVRLAKGNQSFSIVAPATFPVLLPPDSSSFLIEVEANPLTPDRAYVDTLLVVLTCDSFRIPVLAETADPCVTVDDLDFGVLRVGESKTLPLRVCNDGGGEVRFNNPSNGPVIEWLVRNFSVQADELDSLRATVLRRGDCATIRVTFSATVEGSVRDVARLWASVRKCRDTSVWTARVVPTVSAPAALADPSLRLDPARPNPFTGSTELSFETTRRDHVRLAVTDALGREVAVPWDAPADAGRHRVTLAAKGLPAGVYTVTLTSDHVRLSRTVLLLR